MKIARNLGLAVLAALALMASAGAGSALAVETTLCKTTTNSPICGAGDRYPTGTTLKAATPSKLVIAAEFVNIKCNSSLEAKTGAETGNPLSVSVLAWSFSECSFPCKANFTKLPSASLNWDKEANGKLEVYSGVTQPEWDVNCPGIFHCVWSFPNLTFKGGNPAQLEVPEGKLVLVQDLKGTFPCPSGSSLKAGSFTVNSPQPAYVAKPPLAENNIRLCKYKIAGSICEMAITYPFGTTLEAEAPNMKIAFFSTNLNCKAVITTKTLADGASPFPLGPTSFSSTECFSSFFGSCTLTSTNSPSSSITMSGSDKILNIAGLSLRLKCSAGVGIDCFYDFSSGAKLIDQIDSEHPASFSYGEIVLAQTGKGEGLCAGDGKVTAQFNFINPKPLYFV